MKKLFVIIMTFVFISSCSTTKEAKSSDSELRNDKKVEEQAFIKKAIESKRFVIKLEKLYFMYGRTADLLPRYNYIIIDGNKAVISAAYLGRQYDVKAIAGINMRGKTTDYEVTSILSKGKYEIKTKVTNGSDSFDLNLIIGKSGSCNVSLSSLMIDNVNYRGYLVPLKEKNTVPLQKGNEIGDPISDLPVSL
jgi:hypothetical protein